MRGRLAIDNSKSMCNACKKYGHWAGDAAWATTKSCSHQGRRIEGIKECLGRILQKIKLGNVFAERIIFCFEMVTVQALS